jgi:CspA family cold shock protein
MVLGTVRFSNAAQGFFLVTPDGSPHDIIVQVSLLKRLGIDCLRQGQRVKCAVEADRHGRASARDIQLM